MSNVATPLVLVGAFALYVVFLRRFDRFRWKRMAAVGALLALALMGLDRMMPLGPLLAFGLYVAGLVAFYLTF